MNNQATTNQPSSSKAMIRKQKRSRENSSEFIEANVCLASDAGTWAACSLWLFSLKPKAKLTFAKTFLLFKVWQKVLYFLTVRLNQVSLVFGRSSR